MTALPNFGAFRQVNPINILSPELAAERFGAPAIPTVQQMILSPGYPIGQIILALSDVPITVRDTEQGGGIKIYDQVASVVKFMGAVAKDIQITTTSVPADTLNATASAGRFGVGTVTQANAILATTEQNIIPVSTFSPGAQNVPSAAVDAHKVADEIIDGAGTALDWFFNISVPTDTNIDADATVLVNGLLYISVMNLGVKA